MYYNGAVRRKAKCYYCDRPAEYLCDFVLRMSTVLKEPLRDEDDAGEIVRKLMNVDDERSSITTCDRPLCEAHRVKLGTFHASGRAGFFDSIDRCPGHADMPDNPNRTGRVGGGSAA